MKKMIPLLMLAFLYASCASVYFSPDAKMLSSKHKTIAVLPPKVTIAARKKVDAEALKQQQATESENFQKEMYNWLVKRKMRNQIFVEVMDIETTNAKLTRAGYFDGNPMTPAEMAEALGVDGVMTSNYSLSKPMSEGAAVALGLLVGFWGSTNQAAVTLEIHDAGESKLIWNYNHKLDGGIGSTPARLVDALMRNASKKMPYTVL